MRIDEDAKLLFLKSALATDGALVPTESILRWLRERAESVSVSVKRTSIRTIEGWYYDEESGRIRHKTGKFFSIDGIKVSTSWGTKNNWQQPIINQPEVGFLGLLAKEFNGILHFLLQAKIEPGNINHVQLSPTLQATRSNYTRAHMGAAPLFLSYFMAARAGRVLLDQLQSEQGARFLRKRNRNIIILTEEDVPVPENFIWVTLAQIKSLLRLGNVVNMDTRTVISGISYGRYGEDSLRLLEFLLRTQRANRESVGFLESAVSMGRPVNSAEDIMGFLSHLKSQNDLELAPERLDSLEEWVFGEDCIEREDRKFFRVIAVDVSIANREVTNWSQPMVEPAQQGICALVAKRIGGVIHFIVQAKLECGNHDIFEFAPTVQCLTGDFREAGAHTVPFLDYVLGAPEENVVFDVLQSEEGGRFYREQNLNKIVLAGGDFDEKLPDNYVWMTLGQIHDLLRFNNLMNIQIRSLVSALELT